MLNDRTCRVMMVGLCLLACLLIPATAQEKAETQEKAQKPQTISTTPKVIAGKLQGTDDKAFDVRGHATFTITALKSYSSMVGTLVYTIPDDTRKKIAQRIGKPLADIPAGISRKEVIADFEKNTHCPEIHLIFNSMDVEVAGAALRFDRFMLTLNETGEELSQLFCVWTLKIARGVQFEKGVISRINQLLSGEEPENKDKQD